MAREMIRQGGRSARIQAAVHEAVRSLLQDNDRNALTVPMIAEEAGVTPSTIYRRWGDLGQLVADVAVERLRPVTEPEDTGSVAGDIRAYALEFAEEMSSPTGRVLLHDIVAESAADAAAATCCRYTRDNLAIISVRAAARGETAPDMEDVLDLVFAPIVYHILFSGRDVDAGYCLRLLARVTAGQA